MSGAQGQSIDDMATQVVRTDLASQTAVEEQEKGTWTPKTGIGFIPDWSQKGPTATGWSTWQRAIAVLAGIAVLGVGIFTGYTFLNNQPAASLVAAVPTPTATPVTATPVLATPTPTASPVTATPVVSTPTPAPVITPVPVLLADGIEQIVTGDPIGIEDDDDDQGDEGDGIAADDQPGLEYTDGYVALASVDGEQAMAMQGGWIAGTVPAAQVEDLWPCTDPAVFCGPAQLEPGDYVVVGFHTAAPPPTTSEESIYQVFYLLTDLDGDWTNNGLATPPQTNNFYLSTQYVIEAGWYGPTKGLGETDYNGPVGPDGQTPRYNQQAASRMVLSADPPGGFFIVPGDRIGNWFRLGSMWRDFSVERSLTVDAIGAFGRLEMIPVPGRAALPSTLVCGRVQLSGAPLGDRAATLTGAFQLQPGVTLDPGSAANLTLVTGRAPNATEDVQAGLPLEDLGNGVYEFVVGTPVRVAQAFGSLTIGPPGQEMDITEEFIVLTGSGPGVPSGMPAEPVFALGNPACGV